MMARYDTALGAIVLSQDEWLDLVDLVGLPAVTTGGEVPFADALTRLRALVGSRPLSPGYETAIAHLRVALDELERAPR